MMLSDSMLTTVCTVFRQVYARPGVSEVSEEDDSEVDESTLVKPKANGAATAELVQANIGAMAGMIPFQDISQDA